MITYSYHSEYLFVMKIRLRTRQDLKEPKLLAILLSSNQYFS